MGCRYRGRLTTIFLVLACFLTACGSTWQAKARSGIVMAHDILRGSSGIAEPLFAERCMGHAEKCRAMLPEHCEKMLKCQGDRRKFNAAIIDAHMVLAAASIAIEAQQEAEALAKIGEVMRRVVEIEQALQEVQ